MCGQHHGWVKQNFREIILWKNTQETATRQERRKKSSKKKVSYQNTKGGKYTKNLSNRTITDVQISLIS